MEFKGYVILIGLLGLVIGSASGANLSGEELEKLHEIVKTIPAVDPFVKLTIDGKEVEATYYDQRVKAEQYSEKRRTFDRQLMDVIAAFNLDFCEDMLVKKRYLVTIGPKYMSRVTTMIASYLPEYVRLVRASADEGMPVKHGFIGDSTAVWKNIQLALAKPEKKEQAAGELPKDTQEFMSRMESLLQIAQILVRESPVGIYVDWTGVTINGKTLEELGAPLFLYLQEKGYGKHLAVMDSVIGLLSRVKPGAQAYGNQE